MIIAIITMLIISILAFALMLIFMISDSKSYSERDGSEAKTFPRRKWFTVLIVIFLTIAALICYSIKLSWKKPENANEQPTTPVISERIDAGVDVGFHTKTPPICMEDKTLKIPTTKMSPEEISKKLLNIPAPDPDFLASLRMKTSEATVSQEKLCKKKNPAACTELALELFRNNTTENQHTALMYLSEACDQDYDYACSLLAEQYERKVVHDLFVKRVVHRNEETRMFELLARSCNRENYSACYAIGVTYKQGYCERYSPAQSGMYFKKACDIARQQDNIDPHACGELAKLYANGMNGIEKDPQQANDLYQYICEVKKLKWGCFQWGKYLLSGMTHIDKKQGKAALDKSEKGAAP